MLSLAHFTVIEAGPVELVEHAARAGYDAVGLRIQPPLPGDTVVPVVGDDTMKKAVRKALADTGLALLDIEAFWLMPHTKMEDFLIGIVTGAELGARHVLVVGNDPDRARMVDNFARFCDHARRCSIVPMLEFIPYSHVRSLPEAVELLEEAKVDNAGLLVDALHLSRSGGTPADMANYDSGLFRYLHICDAVAAAPPREGLRDEARSRRLYPGEGELWLDDFVRTVPSDTPVAVEVPSAGYPLLDTSERARRSFERTRDAVNRARSR